MTLFAQSIASMDPLWKALLASEFQKSYMQKLMAFLQEEERSGVTVYPPRNQIFNAFAKTPFDEVSVVIIGQDPYHGPGQAHGLSFSVPKGIPIPPSLRNIFQELNADLEIIPPNHGCLEKWAEQGVLLLNATLTVRANAAASHQGRGWEQFTDRVVQLLCERPQPVVFLLWGRSAYEKFRHVQACAATPHLALKAPHPSPLSAHAGFFGCKPFSKTNEFLKKIGGRQIDWAIQG